MQKVSDPLFIKAHSGIVQGVAFNPRDRYMFCSGANDGKVNIYDATGGRPKEIRMNSQNASKTIRAIKFNSDGTRIITATSKRLSVIDPQRAMLVSNYDGCGFQGREMVPLATHPNDPHIAICCCADNGRGYITIDLRKQQPAQYSLNVHSSVIRDIVYFDESWPFNTVDPNTGMTRSQVSIFSLDSDGVCKIRSSDDKQLLIFDLKNRSRCICPTPETYNDDVRDGLYRSMVLIGGDNLFGYMPSREVEMLNFGKFAKPIQRMRFTSNGHFLYIATGERVERYRRIDRELRFLNEVYSHKDNIVDMDISKRDEFLITASKDGTVGLLCLGVPSYGCTGFMQLA